MHSVHTRGSGVPWVRCWDALCSLLAAVHLCCLLSGGSTQIVLLRAQLSSLFQGGICAFFPPFRVKFLPPVAHFCTMSRFHAVFAVLRLWGTFQPHFSVPIPPSPSSEKPPSPPVPPHGHFAHSRCFSEGSGELKWIQAAMGSTVGQGEHGLSPIFGARVNNAHPFGCHHPTPVHPFPSRSQRLLYTRGN